MTQVQAFDRNGQEIHVGDVVKYINTTTIGTVLEIMQDAEGIWALIDTTDLYYIVEMLELTDELPPKKDTDDRTVEKEIEEKLRIREEALSAYSGENIDGPGGAG